MTKWGTGIANNFDKWQYDAGLYYHVVDDKIWPRGIEYQVRYDHTQNRSHTGDFIGPKLDWYTQDGETYAPLSEGGTKILQKGGMRRFAKKDVPYHALDGAWNQCEVIVMGNKYAIHKLNGEIVNVGENLAFSEGILGLQSETAEIFYRNLEIKEFDKDIPIEVFLEK
ncbi:MAG: family 16 glycoside hydrolase [Opitutales bacterium]